MSREKARVTFAIGLVLALTRIENFLKTGNVLNKKPAILHRRFFLNRIEEAQSNNSKTCRRQNSKKFVSQRRTRTQLLCDMLNFAGSTDIKHLSRLARCEWRGRLPVQIHLKASDRLKF
jgi:hypothetical protein